MGMEILTSYDKRKAQFPLGTPTEFYPGILLENYPKPNEKYVVLSTTNVRHALNDGSYSFYMPLTSYIWNLYGFKSITCLVGNTTEWLNPDSPSNMVVQYLRKNPENVILFIEASYENQITVSQTVRLFLGGNIFSDYFLDNTYFITSDADLWPLTEKDHSLPDGKSIVISRPLSRRRKNHHHIALSCIGMTGKIWREVVNFHDCNQRQRPEGPFYSRYISDLHLWKTPKPLVRNSTEIIAYLAKKYGKKFAESQVEASNPDAEKLWFVDQHLITDLVWAWVERNGGDQGTGIKNFRADFL